MDASLNFWNVFVLSAEVETDVPKGCLKWLKLGIGESGGNLEATLAIGLDHASKGGGLSGDLMIRKRFNGAKMQAMRDSDQKGDLVDKH